VWDVQKRDMDEVGSEVGHKGAVIRLDVLLLGRRRHSASGASGMRGNKTLMLLDNKVNQIGTKRTVCA
jgi:hypothetical protein